MFRPMAISVCAALFGSLLLALGAVPVLSSLILKKHVQESEPRWLLWLQARYRGSLEVLLAHRWPALAAASLVLVAALGSLGWIGTEFMPRLDEGMIVIQTKKLPGINVPLSVSASQQVERILLSFPEVAHVVTKLGRPDVATEAMGVYEADIYLELKPAVKWMPPGKSRRLSPAWMRH